ncbi:MAG: GGDEF domain-containing protein [Citromicrobium sp.]|nr:GGDEF domain-containing protein [Citromicrobium sp.]MAO96059.1 GGDEF domain-containing protein [Citromicrobium sp.]MBD76616.1 GGDEF domain-containing protein [Citromicrobium sp.]MBT46893.1 GGDEF domain-containing protein [Citromicrobium sp.]|tara:strand:+ start:6620 stop:8104 length:1485 start_codon:yes stop_codon:yes gene_type:complete
MTNKDTSPEAIRRRTLAALDILDSAPEDEFDALVRAARRIFGARTAYISLIDTDRQWFKSREGFEPSEVSRECSICATAVDEGREIVVENLQEHPVYGKKPEIAAMPHFQFFATIPFMGPSIDGLSAPIGTLCVIDDRPWIAAREELDELRHLAKVIESLLRSRLRAKLLETALIERKELVDELRRTQRQFELAEEMAKVGHWRMDLESQELFWSRQTAAIHAIENPTKEHLEGGLDFFPAHDRPRIAQAVEECVTDGTPYDLELDFRDAKGVFKRVRAIGEREMVEGKPVALIGVFKDITERYKLETQLRAAAHADVLTGLPNRARLTEYLDDGISCKRKHGTPMAVLLIDLDHFKDVNDQLGHEAGDRVLNGVAAQLLGEPFAGQMAARLGGDEFVLVLEDEQLLADLPGTLDLLLGKLRFEIGREGEIMPVSATIGAAWLTDCNDDSSALLRCADYALYQAKRAKRGTASICPDAIAGERLRASPQLRIVN